MGIFNLRIESLVIERNSTSRLKFVEKSEDFNLRIESLVIESSRWGFKDDLHLMDSVSISELRVLLLRVADERSHGERVLYQFQSQN